MSLTKQKFNIDVESFLALPACHVYWKDLDGNYLGCNEYTAKNAGIKLSNMVGKTDNDFPWKDSAHVLRENDQVVALSAMPKTVEESCVLVEGTFQTLLSHKVPLCNLLGDVVGVFGVSFFTNVRQLVDKPVRLLKKKGAVKISQRSVLDNTYHKQHITQRESECLRYLVRGMSAKQIGRELNLSFRTVEFYFERIKNKLSCHSRAELIAKVIDADFFGDLH